MRKYSFESRLGWRGWMRRGGLVGRKRVGFRRRRGQLVYLLRKLQRRLGRNMNALFAWS